jgi:uncharacterized peroxidase-related enzyme
MKKFTVPAKEQVSAGNKVIFENLEKMVGFVPNLYAVLGHSENALSTYLTLQNAPSSLKAKEREVINLVVSQVNECVYCLSAHTAIGKMNGFSDDQIIEIRKGGAPFDNKLDALAKLVKSITANKGHADEKLTDNFYAAGYNEENLVDVIVAIGDKIITNYLHAITKVPVDWPVVPVLN